MVNVSCFCCCCCCCCLSATSISAAFFWNRISLLVWCSIYMHFSWHLLFETPPAKDVRYMWTWWYLIPLFFIINSSTCFVVQPWLLSFSSCLIWCVISSDNSGGLPLFCLFFNPSIYLLYHIFLAIHRPKICFDEGLWLYEQISCLDKLH